MGRTRLIALLLGGALGAGACAAHTPGARALSMDAVLQQTRAADRPSLADWIRAGLQAPGTFGTGHPGLPVVVPPDVRRVWVPTHENPDGELVAGHWVYLRVRDFRWFLETPGSTGAESGQTPVSSPGPPRRPTGAPARPACHGSRCRLRDRAARGARRPGLRRPVSRPGSRRPGRHRRSRGEERHPCTPGPTTVSRR